MVPMKMERTWMPWLRVFQFVDGDGEIYFLFCQSTDVVAVYPPLSAEALMDRSMVLAMSNSMLAD